MDELRSTFDILKSGLPCYEDRPQQIEMAEAVLECMRGSNKLVVEAGTGVGKSFAYLIPAILSDEKTIISTASIALQDQLINKDLAFLQKTLPHEFSFAMLKGKNNYLCVKREREFSELSEPYKRFREWASETGTGDRDELSFIPDFWPMVCGDSNDCGAAQCPFFSECFYYIHYRSLYKKDIVVVNHHLLIYDLMSGFNILPFHEHLVIDEAHQIENVISHVFGSALGHSHVVWLLYRLRSMRIEVAHLLDPLDSFFRGPYAHEKTFAHIPDEVIEDLKKLAEQLALDKVMQRLTLYKESADSDELRDKAETTLGYVRSLQGVIDDFITREDGDKVYYMMSHKKTLELKSNLVESGKPFNDLMNGYESMIMTSATLTTARNFNYIKERLGMPPDSGEEAFKESIIGSPFDYKKQSLLYIDKALPSPDKENNELFQQKSLKVIEELIVASKGRALVLFTSYNHLRFVSENIATDYPFKSQGDMPPSKLVKWFKKTANSVLLATATFWQGIDIRGEALSLVIIVKMPFGSPGDPVYDERCRRLGSRWFSDLALPSAILQVRQGFGRLIRSREDFGVVAILDSRLVTSSYGSSVVSSLPEINITHRIEEVRRFFGSERPLK